MRLKLLQFIFRDFIVVVVEFFEEYIYKILIVGFPVSFCYFFRIKSEYTPQKIRLFKFILVIKPTRCTNFSNLFLE